MHGPRLLLVRHGQTAWNVERRFLGRTDLPLDDLGRAQASALRARMAHVPLTSVWSSPLLRARQTAEGIGDPELDPDLLEMHMGDLEGLSGAEFAERFPELVEAWRSEPHAVALPGGERIEEVRARGLAAIRRIAATLRADDTALVVTHQLLLATVVCELSGESPARFRRFMHRNTGITTVDARSFQVLTFDDASHLVDPG